MAMKKDSLHFVMLPHMLPSRFIPLLDMAKLLAKQNARVTIATSPVLASRFSPHVARVQNSGMPVSLISFPFPTAKVGLPDGVESLDLVHSTDHTMRFYRALFLMRESFEELFGKIEPKPSCIIADSDLSWVAETAQSFGVPRIIFDGRSCFSTLTEHNLYETKAYENVDNEGSLVLPGLPHRVEICRNKLPFQFTHPVTDHTKRLMEKGRESSKKAFGIVINSFYEMEKVYIEELNKIKNGKIWCVGPLSLCNKEISDKVERGNKAVIGERECLGWLEGKKIGSVVYVCLGSLAQLTLAQRVELGLGLEASKRPFIWVVGEMDAADFEKWIGEDGLEERTRGRGLIIRGWAPQVLILSHPAIGAFLTHCGWNSILEGISAGIPLITWPLFAEQFLNEKHVIEVLKIGASVGNEQVINSYDQDRSQARVKREQIMQAVEKVMGKTKEVQEVQERAKSMGNMAIRAMEEGGSSQLNIALLIEDVLELVRHKQSRL